MKNTIKLNLTFVLNNVPSIFSSNLKSNKKELALIIPQNYLYYLTLHIKLTSAWYSTQLTELFAYENALALKLANSDSKNTAKSLSNTVVSYNFHNLFTHSRLFVFTWNSNNQYSRLKSVADLFANANWLEREASEMSGLVFEGKKDLRNLLLTYGDSSAPLRKSVPSIGFKETSYDITNDMLIQTPVVIQI